MRDSSPSSDRDKEYWDELRKRAHLDSKDDYENGWKTTDTSNAGTMEDHLYSLIDPASRENDRGKVFGMAKSFPQVTRDGYKELLYRHLKSKNKGGRGGSDMDSWEEDGEDLEKGEGASHDEHALKLKDFGPFYRFRHIYHAELAEFLGMFVFMCIGLGSTLQMTLGGQMYFNWTGMALTWGFANMAGIYISGGYSGAHLNPVITLNLFFFRGFPFRRVLFFWLAQLLAAVAATAWIFILYYPLLKEVYPDEWTMETGNNFFVALKPGMPVASGWFNEVTGTALIHVIVFAVGDSHNIAPARGMNALVLGFSVMALGCSLGYFTGFGFNPARDMGPRFFMSMVGVPKQIWTTDKWWWLTGEVTGPFLGGFLGSFAYDLFVFDGPESPVNMPLKVKWESLKIFIHDFFHPFQQEGFKFPHEDNDDQLEGTVSLQGQPAGRKRSDEG